MRCAKCHRPLKHASETGYGPVCRKTVKPIPDERDLFYELDRDIEGALFRVELRIAVMAAEARIAVRTGFAAARRRLGVLA